MAHLGKNRMMLLGIEVKSKVKPLQIFHPVWSEVPGCMLKPSQKPCRWFRNPKGQEPGIFHHKTLSMVTIPSMGLVYLPYTCLISMVNVGKYAIHGCY